MKLLTVFLFGASLLSAQPSAVPVEYQAIYTNLSTQITAFDNTVKAGWNGSKSPVLYSPQLQSATSSSYTNLLAPYYYTDNVLPELEEQQALGAKSVTVHIDFPILYQPFYTANPSQYQQFVSFYQQLILDVHARGMKMVVENTAMNAFPGSLAGSFTSYYEGLTWSQYMTGRAANVLNVAQLITPDYMTVITEPDSEAAATGQTTVYSVSGATQLLTTILSTLQAAGSHQVPIGAGAGTWIPSFTQYIQSFASTSVQFVDMHIYPVNNSYFLNALTAAPLIQAAGKEISISEAWDYKVANSELGKLSYTELYARDPFSFWSPMDIDFVQALMDFGNSQKLTFIGPFWSHYFFAYLNYTQYETETDTEIINASDVATGAAIAVGKFTITGLAWKSGIIPAPDKTPPATPSAPYTIEVYPTIIELAWNPTTDNTGVAAYNLYRNGTLYLTTSLRAYNDINLTPGETYTYTLSAFDASGNKSGTSLPLVVETTDTTPPSVPTGLAVVGTTATSVSLTWNASTGIGGVGGYRVLRGSTSTNMTIHSSPTTTSYTDPYCTKNTTYYYAVESFNPAGVTSLPGPYIEVTTP